MSAHVGARKMTEPQVRGYTVVFGSDWCTVWCTGYTQNREIPGQVVHGALHGSYAPHVHVFAPSLEGGNVRAHLSRKVFQKCQTTEGIRNGSD